VNPIIEQQYRVVISCPLTSEINNFSTHIPTSVEVGECGDPTVIFISIPPVESLIIKKLQECLAQAIENEKYKNRQLTEMTDLAYRYSQKIDQLMFKLNNRG